MTFRLNNFSSMCTTAWPTAGCTAAPRSNGTVKGKVARWLKAISDYR